MNYDDYKLATPPSDQACDGCGDWYDDQELTETDRGYLCPGCLADYEQSNDPPGAETQLK